MLKILLSFFRYFRNIRTGKVAPFIERKAAINQNTVRLKFVHPEDKTSKQKQSSVVYAVQRSKDSSGLHKSTN